MSKNKLYLLLAENEIYSKKPVEAHEMIYENDIIVEDEVYGGKYKITTNDMSDDDIIIALLAKQTLYLKSIKGMIKFFFILTIIFMVVSFF